MAKTTVTDKEQKKWPADQFKCDGKLAFVKKSHWVKLERDKKTGEKFITDRKMFGYPVGHTVVISAGDYAEMKKLELIEDFNPEKHPLPKKSHWLHLSDAEKKKILDAKEKSEA